MIVLFLCILLLGYSIYLYDKGQKDKSTFIFFLFLCDGFGFFHSEWLNGMPINKYRDFALLYLLYVTISQHFGTNKITPFQFPLYKWLFFLVLYLTFEFVFTVATGRESLGMSLAVYRKYLFFLSFMLFQELKKQQIRNLIIYVSVATIIAAIVYVSQPIHNLPILDRSVVSGKTAGNWSLRYRNVPELLYFILIYVTVRLDFSKYKSILLILLCGMSLVLTQHRGVMIGYVITIIVYLILSKNIQKAFQYGLIGVIGFIAVGSLVISRFENKEKVNTFDDIYNVANLNYARVAAGGYDDEGGTFSFRVLLFVERFDYFKSNPQYMLTGVGMRHEDSPKTQKEFHFVLGSRKQDKATGYWIPQQIDSGDLVWFVPFMKFGIIGLLFYLYITFRILLFLFHNIRKGTLSLVTFLYYILLIVISMKNDMLFAPIQVSFLLMLIELIRRTGSQNAIDILKYQEFKVLGNKGI